MVGGGGGEWGKEGGERGGGGGWGVGVGGRRVGVELAWQCRSPGKVGSGQFGAASWGGVVISVSN